MKEKDNLKKKEKRPIYEPPRARDLSAFTVDGGTCTNGGGPDGVGCEAGSVPFGCSNGAGP